MQICAVKEHKISPSEIGYIDFFVNDGGFNKSWISKKLKVRI